MNRYFNNIDQIGDVALYMDGDFIFRRRGPFPYKVVAKILGRVSGWAELSEKRYHHADEFGLTPHTRSVENVLQMPSDCCDFEVLALCIIVKG